MIRARVMHNLSKDQAPDGIKLRNVRLSGNYYVVVDNCTLPTCATTSLSINLLPRVPRPKVECTFTSSNDAGFEKPHHLP